MIFKKLICFKIVPGLLDFSGILGSQKMKIKIVLGLGDTSPNPEIIETRVFEFSHKQIEEF